MNNDILTYPRLQPPKTSGPVVFGTGELVQTALVFNH